MTRQVTDSLYVELGYTTPENYAVYVARASSLIASTSTVTAVISKTVDASSTIVSTSTVVASVDVVITAAADLVSTTTVNALAGKSISAEVSMTVESSVIANGTNVKEFNIDTNTVTQLESTANKVTDTSGLLEFFANLNAQADLTRGVSSNLQSQFASSAIGSKTTGSAANIQSVAALSCNFIRIRIVEFSAALNSSFTVFANPISYVLRPNTYNRPLNLFRNGLDTFVTDPVRYGSHSLRVTGNSGGSVTLDSVSAFAVNTNEDFVAEGWFRIDNTDAAAIARNPKLFSLGFAESDLSNITAIPLSRRGFAVGMSAVSGGQRRFIFRYRNEVGWSFANTGVIQPASDTWFHLAVTRQSNTLRLLYNGAEIFSLTGFSNSIIIDSGFARFYFNHGYNLDSPTNNVFYDSFRFARGNSTILGATSQPTDTEQTVVLYNFNNTNNDSYVRAITVSESASLSVTANLSATSSVVNQLRSNIVATSTLSATATKIKQFAASITAASSLSANTRRIRNNQISSQIVSSLSANVLKVKEAECNTTVSANLQVDLEKIATSSANLITQSTLLVSASVINNTSADLTVATNLTALTNFVASFSATADVISNLEVRITAIGNYSADLEARFSLLAVIKTPLVEQYVYVIPRENRSYTIEKEIRSYSIYKEDRIHKIKGSK